MNRNWKSKALQALLLAAVSSMSTSCSMIDDDLDDCEVDFRSRYRLHLVTNEELEIRRVLGNPESELSTTLRSYLSDVFTDYGRDLGLSFYALPDSAPTLPLRDELPTVMNASERSFDIFMPINDYMHLAVANVMQNGSAVLQDASRCHGSRFQISGATVTEASATPTQTPAVGSQRSGLYSGRLLLPDVTYGQHPYDMTLYIANSAAGIAIDPRDCNYTDIAIFTRGFADAFSICDSTFHYGANYLVRADQIRQQTTDTLLFCAVSMPSREVEDIKMNNVRTRSRVEMDEPQFDYHNSGYTIWEYDCYVTLADGHITRTIIGVPHPLRAGQLKLIKGHLRPNGIVELLDHELSVSSDLNWQEGLILP